ncbi:molybdopterin-dependent oxidoreductase [Anoxybacterium hadale]|uniref:Molybdopterin-dependent oxidoreductase n=1 Tax=Anoxybacterium hadale TaxID=3408580 RepID=A0ACD1AEL3_9FIRM|nr:molybdopterin-dependent oxidoreductase [Clostridiales bacterium]
MKQLKKMTLNINGADRMFICDPEKDTLASVLRRLGLTGTKVGCGTGVCGACSTILDGKVIRSCTKKIKTVKEYSSVITIEGLGNPMNPHPIQAAMVHLGAVQCGFCMPGFIVSAYGLLTSNPSPTREDVRDWFQQHRNVCRCTGYKQIVDAVMEAAAIMRGEKTIADIAYDYKKDVGNYYGKPLARPNALAKACGVCDYGDDIELKMPAETLHAVLVMPRVANHARILNIDYSEAEKMPGVVKVITSKDVDGANHLMMFQFSPRTTAMEQVHKLLADEKIINWGTVVAMVVADTKDHAKEAADKVKVEIEQLPEYMNYLDAVMPDAMRIHDSMDNTFTWQPLFKGDTDRIPDMIEEAPHVVEGSFYSSREPHMSIEGDTVQAYYDEDGLLTVQCKAMTTYFDRDDIAQAVGLPVEQIRVVENPTGGSFGWAMNATSYSLAAIACKVTQQPIALSMDYSQFMALSGKRSPAYMNARLACDADGKIIAGEFDAGMDHGYDPALGDDKVIKIARFMFFPYNVPHVLGLGRVAVTNHAFGVPYRGYGAPQAYTCGEALIDMMAEEIGMDPFEFRYKNIAREGETNINSSEFLQYPMEEMMDKMKPLYDKAVAEAKAADTPEVRRGVGLAWGGYNVGLGSDDFANAAIELTSDGKFIKYDTWQDQGQGGDQGSLMCTLEALKPYFPDVLPTDIKLIQADTKYCPNTGESAGSRSHFANGKASILAAQNLANAMRKEDGTYRTYDEMIQEGIPTKYEGNWVAEAEWDNFRLLDPNTGVGSPTYAYTYALFMSEVEVEVATGKTTVIGMTCVDWVGRVGNIQAVNGQAYGGISHAIGFALKENYEDVKKHNNIYSAGVPYIKDIPDKIDVLHMDGFDERGPFGSSGASEAFQSSDHVAVINAINNACGVRIYELPASPDKVKAGLDIIAAGGKVQPPKKYFLGSDFYEELEKIKANPV